MARLNNIVHSGDACTLVFEGDKRNPEPALGAIKFPGGVVEVSRCSDGGYWAHIHVDDPKTIETTRVGYDVSAAREHGIPKIPAESEIKHLAVRVKA